MRHISAYVQAVAVLSVFLISRSATAQKFRDPSREELQMTSDPKALGAPAVFLGITETTDDSLHRMVYYAEIKVLTEAGVTAGNVQIDPPQGDFSVTDIRPKITVDSGDWLVSPTSDKAKVADAWTGFQITGFKARTIHPDGTAIPFEGNIEEGYGGGKVAHLPGVEVGSIVEYSYSVRYGEHHFSAPHWAVQRQYFVHQAHYFFTPFRQFLDLRDNGAGGLLIDSRGNVILVILVSSALPSGVEVRTDAVGYYSLNVKDIPPLPQEEWMPPHAGSGYNVRFYYGHRPPGKDYWPQENARWTKDVDRLAEPAQPIRQAVAAIVAPDDRDLDKARKLYAAVQNLENTDFAPGNTTPLRSGTRSSRRAEATLSSKGGSSQEIVLLYLAMLRSAGLTAYDMRVVGRDHGTYSPDYFSPNQFDDDLVVLSSNGKEIVLDPGEKMCPFQTVDWRHQGVTGLVQSPTGVAAAITPASAYAANTLQRTGDITLDTQGNFTGVFHFVMNGQRAIDWRQLSLTADADKVKMRFDRWLTAMVPSGVEAHLDHFLALDNPDLNLVAIVNLKGSFASSASKALTIPRTIFEAASHHPFVEEATREEPVDMHYAEQVSDQAVYHLPAGLALQEPSPDATLPWPEHAVLAIKAKASPGQVTVTRSFTRAFTLAKPDEYPKLHDYFQKVAAADRQQLVLTSSAASTGN